MTDRARAASRRRAALYLRSLLFAIGQWTSTVLFAPLTLLAWPLPFALRYRFVSNWARFNLWWLERTCALRFRVQGRENIPARPCIVMCKHQSAWETLALQGLFEPQVWVLKRELLWIPFFGWGLAVLRPIAIDRKSGRRAMAQIVAQGRERLGKGIWVVVFPEGTRVAPGQHGKYHIGGAILAERSGASIVPVAHNAGHFWPRRSFVKRPGTIDLIIGPPIASSGRKAAEIIERVEDWIEARMQRLDERP